MIKLVAAVRTNVEILEAIVVIVAHGDAHAVPGALQASSFRNILEGAVGLLMIETVPIRRPRLFGDGALGRRILQRRAVDQENVEPAIVVVVEQRDAGAHRFDQIFPGGMRGLILKIDARFFGDVREMARDIRHGRSFLGLWDLLCEAQGGKNHRTESERATKKRLNPGWG